jgi:hypothetical protein
MKINIVRPVNGDSVRKITYVMGKATKPVQVYVLANDSQWYLQKKVVCMGNYFFGMVILGDEDLPSSPEYTLVAVATSNRPKTPLTALPDGPKSNFVKVKVA